MRLNNYSDTENFCEAIAPRDDLSNTTGSPAFPFGQLDCKVTNNEMITTQQALVIVGPTTELGLPPFNWLDWPENKRQRVGMPNVYDFNWVFMDPNSNFSAILTIDDEESNAVKGNNQVVLNSE